MSKRTCSVNNCGAPMRGRGLCPRHYSEWRSKGTVDGEPRENGIPPCVVEGCDKFRAARGWCAMHHARWAKHGDPLIAVAEVVTVCAVCGKRVTGTSRRRRYCSRACGAIASRHKRSGKTVPLYAPRDALRSTPEQIAPVDKQCVEPGCDRPYKARGYCSTHHQYRYVNGTLQSRFCKGCGTALPEDAPQGQRYCHKECRPTGVTYPAYWKPCERCGLPIDLTITGPAGRRKRSDTKMCDHCRKAKYRRHKTSLGLIVKRDGTQCRLCGDEVSLDLEFPNPASPSVDHILPFSLGGTHDMDNLQLAHLGCNQQKLNRVA